MVLYTVIYYITVMTHEKVLLKVSKHTFVLFVNYFSFDRWISIAYMFCYKKKKINESSYDSPRSEFVPKKFIFERVHFKIIKLRKHDLKCPELTVCDGHAPSLKC